MRQYATLQALRQGQTIFIEHILVKMTEGEIQPGDRYVAERNTGPKLLTAASINTEFGCIYPVENGYPFDLGECVRVRLV